MAPDFPIRSALHLSLSQEAPDNLVRFNFKSENSSLKDNRFGESVESFHVNTGTESPSTGSRTRKAWEVNPPNGLTVDNENSSDVTSLSRKEISIRYQKLNAQKNANNYVLTSYFRFDDIAVNEKTLVPLYTHNDSRVDAQTINANWITITDNWKVIASQYPYENEITDGLFWQMTAQQQVVLIIDLTRAKDKVREHYYPDDKSLKTYGNYTVQSDALPLSDKCYKLNISDRQTQKSHLVTRYHFTGWPDFGICSAKNLSELVNLCASYKRETILIHCRAGVGRTGVVLAGLKLLSIFNKGLLTHENVYEMMDDCILNIRSDRSLGCVQTEEQYTLAIDYALYLLSQVSAV